MRTLTTIVAGIVLIVAAYLSVGLGFDTVYPCPFDFYPDCDPDRVVRVAIYCLYGFLTMIVLALVVRLVKQPRAAFIALLMCLVLPVVMLVASGFEIYRLLNYQPDLDLSNIENLGEAMELDFSIAEWWSEAYAGMTFALAAIFLTVLQYLFAMRFLGRPAAVSSSEERASAHNKATASSEAGKTTSPAIAQPPEPDLPVWYIGRGDAQHGPYSDRQFNELVQAKSIFESDHIWREGWSDWLPANEAIAKSLRTNK